MIKGLSEKLKLLRKQYALSQRAVASHLGISTSVISAYENWGTYTKYGEPAGAFLPI